NTHQHAQACSPCIYHVSCAAARGSRYVDGHRNARCGCQPETCSLHSGKQQKFRITIHKGISQNSRQHNECGVKEHVFPFIFIDQIGMERTDSKHGHRKDQKHAARLPDGNTQLLSHHKRKQREKHIDGYEQQQICRTHPPKIECHEFVSTVLSHLGNHNSSHRIHNG